MMAKARLIMIAGRAPLRCAGALFVASGLLVANGAPCSASPVRPTILELSVGAQGSARVAGACAPRVDVEICLDGRIQRAVRCDRYGRFQVRIVDAFGVGEHVLSTSVKLETGSKGLGQDVRVFIPVGFGGGELIAVGIEGDRSDRSIVDEQFQTNAPIGVPSDVRDLAEELAQAASERFSQLTAPDGFVGGPQTDDAGGREDGESERAPSGRESKPSEEGEPWTRQYIHDQATHAAGLAQEWLTYSQTIYSSRVVSKLAQRDGARARHVDIPLPARPYEQPGFGMSDVNSPQTALSWARAWFEGAYGAYKTRIVKSLAVPGPVMLPGPDGGKVVVAVDDDDVTAAPDTVPVIDPPLQPAAAPVEKHTYEVEPAPSGRLANAGQVSRSNSASVVEKERLALAWERGGGKVETPVAPGGRVPLPVAKGTLVPKAAKTEDALPVAPADVENLNPAIVAAERRRVARAEAVARLNEKFERERLERERLQSSLRREEAARVDARADAGGVADTKPAGVSSPRDVIVVLPDRRPVRSARKFEAPGRSALGARAVAVPARKVKRRASSSRKATRRAKSRRARKTKIARRGQVRSYRKRAKRAKGVARRGRCSKRARTYVVRRGDTLWDIARCHYGSGKRYRRIHKANRGKIRNPHKIYPNQRLRLPKMKR